MLHLKRTRRCSVHILYQFKLFNINRLPEQIKNFSYFLLIRRSTSYQDKVMLLSGYKNSTILKGNIPSWSFPVAWTKHRCSVCTFLLRVGVRHLSACYQRGSPLSVTASNHLRGSIPDSRVHPPPWCSVTTTHSARGAHMLPAALRRFMQAPVHKCNTETRTHYVMS